VPLSDIIQCGINSSTGHDAFLAKLTDQGSSATFGWVQVAGGYSGDIGQDA
jgi:hypothetical protein